MIDIVLDTVLTFILGLLLGGSIVGIVFSFKLPGIKNRAARAQHKVDNECVKAFGGPPLPPPNEYEMRGG